MAIGAAERIDDLRAQFAPLVLVELRDSLLVHHTGNVGTLARPAGSGLHVGGVRIGCAGAQGRTHVLDGVGMAPWCGVIARESVTRPKYHHLGPLRQYVLGCITQMFASEVGFGRFFPRVVFTREVLAPDFVAWFDARDLDLHIVVECGDLRPPLRDRRGQQAEQEHAHHDCTQNAPSDNGLAADRFR